MSILLSNWVNTKYQRLPHVFFDGYISKASSIVLTDAEIECYDMALTLLERALRSDGYDRPPLHAAIYFTIDGSLSLSFYNKQAMGMHQSMIIYAVGKWRFMRYTKTQMLTIMLEELCHCFYTIWDEEAVKEKVCQIVRTWIPGTTRNSLYKCFDDPAR